MGPLNTPISTFFAWMVTGLSILIAIVWAYVDWRISRMRDKEKDFKSKNL
jgi:hypothetical protein